VTPERFWLAALLFHAAVLAATFRVVVRWPTAACERPARPWAVRLLTDLGGWALLVLVAANLAPLGTNAGRLRGIMLGDIVLRLFGQALFGEAILLLFVLAYRHGRTARHARAAALAAGAVLLVAIYARAYRVEPGMLEVRHHEVDRTAGMGAWRSLRILHLTDIQSPTIGRHERQALEAGLAAGPALIVMTGDYVQDAMGRHTEPRAAADLRALMARLGFTAPLGVFATDGDAGPPCEVVFARTAVRCLVDASVGVELPGGGTLSITGLSRRHGRERHPEVLRRLLESAPPADARLVISHSPDFADALPEPVDLVLAGHTHGGQVVLPMFGPPRTASRLPRLFAGGLHDLAGTPVHVSRGVGMERGFAPPLRFLCPPEICVLDVRLPGPRMRAARSMDPPRADRARGMPAPGSP